MGYREAKVEKYLDKKVKEAGGISRKWVSPGRDGVPDRIVIHDGTVHFVEIKTVDGRLSKNQNREQARLVKAGANVHTLCGENEIDGFVDMVLKR
jgi:hypothetical protein